MLRSQQRASGRMGCAPVVSQAAQISSCAWTRLRHPPCPSSLQNAVPVPMVRWARLHCARYSHSQLPVRAIATKYEILAQLLVALPFAPVMVSPSSPVFRAMSAWRDACGSCCTLLSALGSHRCHRGFRPDQTNTDHVGQSLTVCSAAYIYIYMCDVSMDVTCTGT